jgi:glycosyltransferase involved in cell wall biosynthesis
MMISLAICCYNSAKRLPETLAHLARQQDWSGCEEILLINNASTDDTIEVAQRVWTSMPMGPDIPELRVIPEPEPGLSHARNRAFREASGDVVCFLDDDNWPEARWLATVREIFNDHPEVVAAGGPIHEVLEKEPAPGWWETYKGNFTIWHPRDTAGYWERPLCGAGLCVRRSAWAKLVASGFRSRLADRTGAQLSSGGDFELCYALMHQGGRLWYDPRLLIRHFMPASRLTWTHLRRLNRGFGSQSVVLDEYAGNAPISAHSRLVECIAILKDLLVCLPALLRNREGSARVLFFEFRYGRLGQLLRHPA